MSGMKAPDSETDLSALLDDALDAFLQPGGPPQVPASHNEEVKESIKPPSRDDGPSATSTAPDSSFSVLPRGAGGGQERNIKGLGLGVKPLNPSRNKPTAGSSSGKTTAGAPVATGQAAPGVDSLESLFGDLDLDALGDSLGDSDVAAGLTKLLEELGMKMDASSDSDMDASGILEQLASMSIPPPVQQTSPSPSPSPSTTGGNGGLLSDIGASATLRALAEQQPRFERNQPGPRGLGGGQLPIPGLSGKGLGGGGAVSAQEEQLLRTLTEQLQKFAGDDDDDADIDDIRGEGGDNTTGGMNALIDTIMQQLLSKDVLYQPLKDIGGKYPSWLDENRDTLSSEDVQRYEEQYGYICQIVKLYEEDPGNFEQLVVLLQEMQQRGQPPQEIVDELAPGMSFGADGLPSFGGEGGPSGAAGPPDCCIQ